MAWHMTLGNTSNKLHEIHDVLTNKDYWLPVSLHSKQLGK